ncbi:MAG TPA: hypothetical protein VM033_03580 [Gemmatimonadaceae bacterium]|nr:hypothetical protein [Gemmatimonadaceae bacterium]
MHSLSDSLRARLFRNSSLFVIALMVLLPIASGAQSKSATVGTSLTVLRSVTAPAFSAATVSVDNNGFATVRPRAPLAAATSRFVTTQMVTDEAGRRVERLNVAPDARGGAARAAISDSGAARVRVTRYLADAAT